MVIKSCLFVEVLLSVDLQCDSVDVFTPSTSMSCSNKSLQVFRVKNLVPNRDINNVSLQRFQWERLDQNKKIDMTFWGVARLRRVIVHLVAPLPDKAVTIVCRCCESQHSCSDIVCRKQPTCTISPRRALHRILICRPTSCYFKRFTRHYQLDKNRIASPWLSGFLRGLFTDDFTVFSSSVSCQHCVSFCSIVTTWII